MADALQAYKALATWTSPWKDSMVLQYPASILSLTPGSSHCTCHTYVHAGGLGSIKASESQAAEACVIWKHDGSSYACSTSRLMTSLGLSLLCNSVIWKA